MKMSVFAIDRVVNNGSFYRIKTLKGRFGTRWISSCINAHPWMPLLGSISTEYNNQIRTYQKRHFIQPPLSSESNHVSSQPPHSSGRVSTPIVKDTQPVSSSPSLLDRRILLRILLTLGTCGFLSSCGYLLYVSKYDSQNSSEISILYSDRSPSSSGFLSTIETWFETFTDTLLNILDQYVPLSPGPLLPDVADLKYPENLPTLVIDLDKVLVKMEHDRKTGWRVIKRPGADEFFKELVYHYELVVWSDDNFPVAQEVCSKWGVPVVGALHRDQCKRGRRGHYIKDLSRLGRRLDRLLILDHDPVAFSLQPDNGITISEYHGNPNDSDLFGLTEFLKVAALSPHSDIRDFVKDYGGGDVGLVNRWRIERSEQEKKAESRRSIGTRLFGFSSGASHGASRSLGWS